jgi:allophanate hydrolase subunit 2
MGALRVRHVGLATSVRDGGRTGLAHLGSGRGGAVDLDSHRLVNRLVGNHPDAATVETSGGLVVEVGRPVLVAVAGSQVDLQVEHGPPLGWGVATALPAGAVVRVGRLRDGARCYLAVRGGVDGVGWPESLDVAAEVMGLPSEAIAVPRGFDRAVRLWPGPRLDWFEPGTWDVLVGAEWTVSATSDRVGLRLVGPMLRRAVPDELPSEGVVEGAVQVPPDGQPIVMLADHPVTGGYPVVAVVDPADIGLVAQHRPGAQVTFRRAR